MKKAILPVLMSAMFVVPAVSHAENQEAVKQLTPKTEQAMQKTGWVKEGNTWYFYDQNGVKQTGWIENGNFYLNADGTMKTGWLQDKGKWYHFDEDGRITLKLKTINGKTYYFGT